MHYIYAHTQSNTDDQGAALLSLLWYKFGRASDLTFVQKQHLSVCSENVFFVRFVRIKKPEEQGSPLHPDGNRTCPFLAIALALAMQTTPSVTLIDHLRAAAIMNDSSAVESAPLGELLAFQVDGNSSQALDALKDLQI